MKELNKIITLTSLTVLLTVTLFGFTLVYQDNLDPYEFGCGTVPGDNFYNGAAEFESDLSQALIDKDPLAKHGEMLYKANCKACHRLNHKLIGPALQNVYSRRDSVWLRQMIVDGNQLVKQKNKIAVALFKEYNEMQHVSFTSFKENDVTALMLYLKAAEEGIN